MRVTRRTGLVPPCKAFPAQAQDLIAPVLAVTGFVGIWRFAGHGGESYHWRKTVISHVIRKFIRKCKSSLVERVAGIEPAYSAWKAAALPLSYTRGRGSVVTEWWRELDLNQRRLSQRIYSPSPLTTRASLQYSDRIKRPSFSLDCGSTRVPQSAPGI